MTFSTYFACKASHLSTSSQACSLLLLCILMISDISFCFTASSCQRQPEISQHSLLVLCILIIWDISFCCTAWSCQCQHEVLENIQQLKVWLMTRNLHNKPFGTYAFDKMLSLHSRQMSPSLVGQNIWAHEIMALFILHKPILQKCMRNHPNGLYFWVLVGPFVYFHTSCVRTAKALAKLHGYAGSPEPSLFPYAISTISSWAGYFVTCF